MLFVGRTILPLVAEKQTLHHRIANFSKPADVLFGLCCRHVFAFTAKHSFRTTVYVTAVQWLETQHMYADSRSVVGPCRNLPGRSCEVRSCRSGSLPVGHFQGDVCRPQKGPSTEREPRPRTTHIATQRAPNFRKNGHGFAPTRRPQLQCILVGEVAFL